MSKLFRLSVLAAALLMPLSFAASPLRGADRIKVVASFSILADLVRQIGGERIEIAVLVGPNTDMHVFQPTPAHAKLLLDARLVIINGLGFEGWADRLVKASGSKGETVVASKGVTAQGADKQDGHSHGRGKAHAHAGGNQDPHAWQDVANAKIYVANIRDALIAADPSEKSRYETAATAYLAQLDALEAEIRAEFAPIPEAQRRAITSHDSFGYFGRAYGVAFLAAQGVSGDSEPTAKGVATLIRQIKRQRVRAVFLENISNPRLIEQIARETGVTLGGTLYSDALSEPFGPAGTYVDMMRHNAQALAAAMK